MQHNLTSTAVAPNLFLVAAIQKSSYIFNWDPLFFPHRAFSVSLLYVMISEEIKLTYIKRPLKNPRQLGHLMEMSNSHKTDSDYLRWSKKEANETRMDYKASDTRAQARGKDTSKM